MALQSWWMSRRERLQIREECLRPQRGANGAAPQPAWRRVPAVLCAPQISRQRCAKVRKSEKMFIAGLSRSQEAVFSRSQEAVLEASSATRHKRCQICGMGIHARRLHGCSDPCLNYDNIALLGGNVVSKLYGVHAKTPESAFVHVQLVQNYRKNKLKHAESVCVLKPGNNVYLQLGAYT